MFQDEMVNARALISKQAKTIQQQQDLINKQQEMIIGMQERHQIFFSKQMDVYTILDSLTNQNSTYTDEEFNRALETVQKMLIDVQVERAKAKGQQVPPPKPPRAPDSSEDKDELPDL